MDKIFKQLLELEKKELLEMAAENKVDVKNYWNKKKISEAIREKQIADEAAAAGQGGNPEFEQQLKDNLQETVSRTPDEKRGGFREGSGRPEGMTNDKAAVRNLPTVPNESIKKGCEMLFGLWSNSMKIPEIALNDAEAEALALPVTQLQEYYLAGQVPEIAWVWIGAIGTFYAIADTRIKIIKEVRANAKAGHKIDPGQDGIGEDDQGSESNQKP